MSEAEIELISIGIPVGLPQSACGTRIRHINFPSRHLSGALIDSIKIGRPGRGFDLPGDETGIDRIISIVISHFCHGALHDAVCGENIDSLSVFRILQLQIIGNSPQDNAGIIDRGAWGIFPHRVVSEISLIHHYGTSELLQVCCAGDGMGFHTRGIQSGKKKSRQNGDNRNYNHYIIK